MAVCSWISVPTAVPFTLQTFAVFMAVGVLGGRRGTMSVALYIILGAVGVPVFAGMTGGIGILTGTTGGYIVGFFIFCPCYVGNGKDSRKKSVIQILSMAVGLIVCYAFGTVWFMAVYNETSGPVG